MAFYITAVEDSHILSSVYFHTKGKTRSLDNTRKMLCKLSFLPRLCQCSKKTKHPPHPPIHLASLYLGFISHWQSPLTLSSLWELVKYFPRGCMFVPRELESTCHLVKCYSSMFDSQQQTGMCPGSRSKPFFLFVSKTPQGPTPWMNVACGYLWKPKSEHYTTPNVHKNVHFFSYLKSDLSNLSFQCVCCGIAVCCHLVVEVSLSHCRWRGGPLHSISYVTCNMDKVVQGRQ